MSMEMLANSKVCEGPTGPSFAAVSFNSLVMVIAIIVGVTVFDPA